jgi:hypothetical protein
VQYPADAPDFGGCFSHVRMVLEGGGPRREFFFAALKSCRACRDELFLSPTKPFWMPGATVLKPLPGMRLCNEAPQRRIQGAQTN